MDFAWFKALPTWLQVILVTMAAAAGLTVVAYINKLRRYGFRQGTVSWITGEIMDVHPNVSIEHAINVIAREKDLTKRRAMVLRFREATKAMDAVVVDAPPAPSAPTPAPATQEPLLNIDPKPVSQEQPAPVNVPQ